jgi:hypothetical protein
MEVVEDGTPLYASIQMSLKPKIMPDIVNFRSYFRGINRNSFENNMDTSNDVLYNTIEGSVADLKDVISNAAGPLVDGTVNVINQGLDVLREFPKLLNNPLTGQQ